MQYYIEKCSVVDIDADIIVNAANNHLLPGGGVCEAIFEKAGEDKLFKECKEYGFVATGNVAVTEGYDTGAKIIIHAVGPSKYFNPDWKELLEKLYKNILTTADESGLHTIAIPCISVGHCGCPLEESSLIAMKVVNEYNPSNLKECYLCCYSDKEYTTYKKTGCMLKYNISHEEYNTYEQYILNLINETHNKCITISPLGFYIKDKDNDTICTCSLPPNIGFMYIEIARSSNLFIAKNGDMEIHVTLNKKD